jgi:nucleoside-diphosphate-sugar epimerase
MNHVVLGANGVTGRETISALLSAGVDVSAVARNAHPDAAVPTTAVDLRDAEATRRALKGADVAYLTVGVPYSTKVWQREWPLILANVIEASIDNRTHLVFFDNVYLYGAVDAPMTESTVVAPVSRKGAIRGRLVEQLENARRDRGLEVTVARAADFYGPGAATSVFNQFVIDAVARGKAPTWLFDATQPHSMTYTPDIGKALAIIGTDVRARGRTWHLPTAPARTGEEYLALATGGALPHKTMSRAVMRFGGLFVPAARESVEMAYQYTAPYIFDSTAFERAFDVAPTPYATGIARSLEHAKATAR